MTRLEQHQAERIAALTEALEKVWDAFDGGPDHPWIPGGDATKELRKDVAKALGKPTPGRKVIGYRRGSGKPIYELQPGMVYTACMISCHDCRNPIRSMGGPMQDALCLDCWDPK